MSICVRGGDKSRANRIVLFCKIWEFILGFGKYAKLYQGPDLLFRVDEFNFFILSDFVNIYSKTMQSSWTMNIK